MQKINEISDSLWLQNYFKTWSNPKSKIEQLVKNKEIIRVRRGLYLDAGSVDNIRYILSLSNLVYGPSYISFIYALRWYGLVPEHVVEITSATFGKRKRKVFNSDIGRFSYQDIPAAAYPEAVRLDNSSKPYYLIAFPEKALCDQLYLIKGITTVKDIKEYLFDDLRIDLSLYNNLDSSLMHKLSGLYHTRTHETFKRFLGKSYA